MTRFTDSPYERMMTRRPEGGKAASRPPSSSPGHPCYGCGNYRPGQPCVGFCHKELTAWLRERRESKMNYFIQFLIVFDLICSGVYFGGDIVCTALAKVRKNRDRRRRI